MARVQNFLEGAGNVLGPSGIFSERTRAKNTVSPDGGQDPTIRGAVLWGGPLWGAAPFWWKNVGGPPMVGATPTNGGDMLGRWGPPWEPLNVAGQGEGGPHGAILPPLVG